MHWETHVVHDVQIFPECATYFLSHFEILSGVEEGAEVVAGPFKTLRELESGDRVKPKKRRSTR